MGTSQIRRSGGMVLLVEVDPVCINQGDEEEKRAQISCMDLIYECSVAAIVAAGGKDSAFGLPGVMTRSRIPQPSITLQGITLCSTLPNPVYTTRRSGWMTRGWTFQEAIFSKRRLCFTEHQVVFECDDSIYTEVFNQPWDLEVCQWQHEQNVFTTADIPGDSAMLQSLIICGNIGKYSGRNLTLETDALNAFFSLFMRMERLKKPLYQFYGLPILKRTSNDEDGSDEDDGDRDGEEEDDSEEESEEESEEKDDDENKEEADDENEQSITAPELAYTKPVNFLVEALCWYHTPALPDEMAAI